MGDGARFQIQGQKGIIRRDQKVIAVDPAGSRDIIVELPFKLLPVLDAEQPLANDVEPEQLLAFGMPKCAFAKAAPAVVIDVGHGSS